MADTGTHMSKSKNKNEVKLKYTTIVSGVDGNESKPESNITLQEAFKRYRKAKQRELRKAKLLRKRNELRKADPTKMAVLRKKFVDQAKKYFGYPYAKKYWPPDSPEYKSKLFLDCCGLVRQVMRDLMYDFGFIIGPWNQAYMYDTLPKTVQREEDMKPGDLVFVSATYYNPKSKKQRHNMTHVEIWLGDGPKTIGSRWNNGKVQVWDSYKFLAKSYYNETYHFKSIDTWLKGICESHCSEHRWKRRKYSPSKKSIFHVESDQDLQQQDEPAGDEGNEDNFMIRGSTFCGATSNSGELADKTEVTGDEEQETDDEMCNASPDTDQEDGEEDTENLADIGEDVEQEADMKRQVMSSNEGLQASPRFSVGLQNRGVYIQDLIGKNNQEMVDGNGFEEYVDIPTGDLLAACSICQDKLVGSSSEDSILTKSRSTKNSEINDIPGKNNIGKQNIAIKTQSGSELEGKADILPGMNGATKDADNDFQKMKLAVADKNTNQNAFIEKEKEGEKKNKEVNTGTAVKVSSSKHMAEDLGAACSGRVSADSLDEETTSSRAGSRMCTMSDISLADSQYSEKGAS